jgi:hypothetical protein
MDEREDKIRTRAYEIWERQGRTGDPQDHWLEAERSLKAEEAQGTAQDRPAAIVQEASPLEAVEALEATGNGAAKRQRSSSAKA